MSASEWVAAHGPGVLTALIATAAFVDNRINRRKLEQTTRETLQQNVGSRLEVVELKQRETQAWIDNHSIDRMEWNPLVRDVELLKTSVIGMGDKLADIKDLITRLDAKVDSSNSLSNMAQAGLAKELSRLTDKVDGARTAA